MSVDVNKLFQQIEELRSQLTSAVQSGNITVQGPEPILDDDTPAGARAALSRFHASVAHNPDVVHKALAQHSLLVNDLYDKVAELQSHASDYAQRVQALERKSDKSSE